MIAVVTLFLTPALLYSQNEMRTVPADASSQSEAARADVSRTISQPSRPITPPSNTHASQPSATGSIWTTLGALSLVVVLILLGARVFKAHSPLAGTPVTPKAIEPLGKRSLDQRHTIHLVRFGSRILILGASSDGLQMLSEMTDSAEVASLTDLCRRSQTDPSWDKAFRSLFQSRTSETRHDSSPTASIPRGEMSGMRESCNGFNDSHIPDENTPEDPWGRIPAGAAHPTKRRLEGAPYA